MGKSIQHKKYQRLTIQEMKNEVLGNIYLEKGLAYTLYMMIKDPERLLSIYLYEDRGRVFNPFRFLLIGVAVSTIILINHKGFQLHLDGLRSQHREMFTILENKLNLPIWETFHTAQEVFLSYQNIFMILSLPVVSWITYKFFRITKFNYAEHIAINGFVFGAIHWLSAMMVLLSYFSESSLVALYLNSIIPFILATYIYWRIFGKNVFKSFLGIVLAYIPIYLFGIVSQLLIFAVLLITVYLQ